MTRPIPIRTQTTCNAPPTAARRRRDSSSRILGGPGSCSWPPAAQRRMACPRSSWRRWTRWMRVWPPGFRARWNSCGRRSAWAPSPTETVYVGRRMPWVQVYDPLHSAWLSTLVAALPIVVLLTTLGVLEWRAHWSIGLALATALAVAVVVYGMPASAGGAAGPSGAGHGIPPL